MILNAARGKPLREEFSFKNEKGRLISAPNGEYKLLLERGDFVREYQLGRQRTGALWLLSSDEVDDLPYSTLYLTVSFNGGEVARGVLRVN